MPKIKETNGMKESKGPKALKEIRMTAPRYLRKHKVIYLKIIGLNEDLISTY